MEISARLEDAIVNYLNVRAAQSEALMQQVQEEIQHRREMAEKLKEVMGAKGVELFGPIDSREELDDLLFGGDEDDEDTST